jgi:hypothetical protein
MGGMERRQDQAMKHMVSIHHGLEKKYILR